MNAPQISRRSAEADAPPPNRSSAGGSAARDPPYVSYSYFVTNSQDASFAGMATV